MTPKHPPGPPMTLGNMTERGDQVTLINIQSLSGPPQIGNKIAMGDGNNDIVFSYNTEFGAN